MFNIKKISTNLENKPVVNTVKSGATVVLKQTLSNTTKDVNGTPLDPWSSTVGQCKIGKISKSFGTLQDCFVDGSGSMVFRILVTASTTKDSNLCPGVHLSIFWGTGEGGGCG